MDWIGIAIVLAFIVAVIAWKLAGQISVERAQSCLEQGAKVIDVRNPSEYRAGHLPGTINIPLSDLREQIAAQAPNKEQVLLLHCASGGRSGMGARLLKQAGYANAFNLGSYGRAQKIMHRAL